MGHTDALVPRQVRDAEPKRSISSNTNFFNSNRSGIIQFYVFISSDTYYDRSDNLRIC
jgi:hypothetical protein